MAINLYTLIIYTIIYIVQSGINLNNSNEQYHITDYILSFNTYHFEWNKHHFTTKTSNHDVRSCTIHIPSLCIHYTPNTSGFIIHFNNSSYDFMKDNDWTQINYIHTAHSLSLYNRFISTVNDSLDNIEYYPDEDDDVDPHFPGRRLLRSRARCRVYLYRDAKFSGRKGGTFTRRRYTTSALRRRGFRGGVKSIRVRGSRCCTAKLYPHDGFRGRRVRFKRGSYSRIRRRKHRIEALGSMKVYCRRSRIGEGLGRAGRGIGRAGRAMGRGLGRFGELLGRGVSALNGQQSTQPIPILLGPMTGMLGHFGYSMHPVMPPQMAMMHGMMGNYGNGMGLPMMNHPMYGHPTFGSGYGMPMGSMGMGGMAQNNMQQQQGGQTPVVDVYTDSGTGTSAQSSYVSQRRRILLDVYNGVGLRKCVVIDGGEICGTFYFAEKVITLDYTVKRDKVVRLDYNIEDQVLVEYEEDESMDDGEVVIQDDEYSDWLIQHQDYGLIRNERIFEVDIDEEIMEYYKEDLVDIVNTVSWVWNKHECNDKMMRFINMSLCTMNRDKDIVLYSKYNSLDVEDEWELDEFSMSVGNEIDWDEIYHINMFRESKINNRKLCRVISMIKVCVEMDDDDYVKGTIKDMLISIEFLY